MAAPLVVITGLEPLAGAGLAINLAYLALDRFRYRGQIEPVAERKCSKNDEEGSFDGFHDLDAVKELKWLARRETSEVFVPRGRGAIVYRYMFRKHQDVYFSIGAASICAFTLASGVALNVGRWQWSNLLLNPPIPGTLFYSCLLAVIIPATFVVLGRKCASWGADRIEYCTSQVAISLGALAQSARAPQVEPPPAQAAPRAGPSLVYDPETGKMRFE